MDEINIAHTHTHTHPEVNECSFVGALRSNGDTSNTIVSSVSSSYFLETRPTPCLVFGR